MRRVVCCLLLAACGGNPAPEKTAPAPTAPPGPPVPVIARTLFAIEANGTRLTYRISGDSTKTPVVFIHGSLADSRSWTRQEPAFAQYFRVLVYSRRYHRPNPQTEDNQPYSAKLHAEDLAALLLTLNFSSAHVVGSGYGGYIALTLAREHPDMVRSLILEEPPIVSVLTASAAGGPVRRAFFSWAFDLVGGALSAFYFVAGVR